MEKYRNDKTVTPQKSSLWYAWDASATSSQQQRQKIDTLLGPFLSSYVEAAHPSDETSARSRAGRNTSNPPPKYTYEGGRRLGVGIASR